MALPLKGIFVNQNTINCMHQIGWIDFSRSHYNKVIMVMEMFKERGVIDELGLGTVRDSISDQLFPGTSTIQTRAKYFLLIPWIFQDIERDGQFDRFHSELEQTETHFIRVLKKHPSNKGIIGGRLKSANPVRKASSIYWRGLSKYGILKFNGSISDYINHVQHQHKKLQKQGRVIIEKEGNLASDDKDAYHMYESHLWCQLPKPPDDWKQKMTIELNEDEALFLSERIIRSCPDSLWAYTLRHLGAEALTFTSVDAFLSVNDLPQGFRTLVQLASDFNLIMKGALVRYNFLIQSIRENGRVDELAKHWQGYVSEIKKFDWRRWHTPALWKYCPNIPPPTQRFVESWIELVKQPSFNEAKGDQLIKDRELRLKGIKRARLQDKAIAQKQEANTGFTGDEEGNLYYLTYRWGTVKTFLTDIQNGLNNHVEAE